MNIKTKISLEDNIAKKKELKFITIKEIPDFLPQIPRKRIYEAEKANR